MTSFEPLTPLSALAMETGRIGLIATASTTYDEPYHIARRFASLDHLSGGRAGWNVVTTGTPETSHNFGSDVHRYARAREFHDVVMGLWDSWADDVSGFDPDGPLPEIPESNASKSGRDRMVDSREMPWRSRQRCSALRLRVGRQDRKRGTGRVTSWHFTAAGVFSRQRQKALERNYVAPGPAG